MSVRFLGFPLKGSIGSVPLINELNNPKMIKRHGECANVELITVKYNATHDGMSVLRVEDLGGAHGRFYLHIL